MECKLCEKSFSNRSNLKKHLSKFHPDAEPLSRLPKGLSLKNFYFKCDACKKQFNHKQNLVYHMKMKHTKPASGSETACSNVVSNQFKCPMCSSTKNLEQEIIKHFTEVHDLQIKCEEHLFKTKEDFQKWLSSIEKSTKSKYIKKKCFTSKSHKTIKLRCHRSGFYVPRGKGTKHLKTQGSNKINAFCPASVVLTINNKGECTVKYIAKHVGHLTDIGHLYLTKEEGDQLATKIALKIPFSTILDQVRDSVSGSELERLHLLTKKDLYNIESGYNLYSSAVRHKDDGISVHSWVQEMMNNGIVLFYKPQDQECPGHPFLRSEDFVLMIMTEAQCEILQKFGSDCICIDGTHGVNGYGFELHTILILDDLRQGFPCGFLISNRSDTDTMSLFFSHIKEKTGIIECSVFMSDITEIYFGAWVRVMKHPKSRLYCTWHIDRAWRGNLSKIKIKEKQVIVHKRLRSLLQETDVVCFSRIMESFLNELSSDLDTQSFAEYFTKYYARKSELWAYCHRLHLGLNTNMHVERMHKTLKYLYLNGKHVKRLDKALGSIMKMVKDKLFDQLIVMHKGKVCSKLRDMRQRHKTSFGLDVSNIFPCEGGGWDIISSSNNSHIYHIEENSSNNCNCPLVCTDCGFCMHRFKCSCIDSAIKWNMCKHIHLLGRKLSISQGIADNEQAVEDLLVIDTDGAEKISHKSAILKDLSNNVANEDLLKKELEATSLYFNNLLKNVTNMEQLKVIQTAIRPIESTLNAMSAVNSASGMIFPNKLQDVPHNKSITPQRLYRTKAVKKNMKKNVVQKPSNEEIENIVLDLVLTK